MLSLSVQFFYRHELLKPYKYYWRYLYHLLSVLLVTDCLQGRVSYSKFVTILALMFNEAECQVFLRPRL
jgi:hypothetical protein